MCAACTADGNGVTYNEHINVALAVAMPDGGLITPVIKDADATDIYQISRNWADLVKRARSKQLAPDEFQSGTFTISNLGNFGADIFDAILPPGALSCKQGTCMECLCFPAAAGQSWPNLVLAQMRFPKSLCGHLFRRNSHHTLEVLQILELHQKKNRGGRCLHGFYVVLSCHQQCKICQAAMTGL